MRLLILAYDFPPNGSIGGQRPYSWFKYLKESGIHPVVVTRHWETVLTPKDTIRPCDSEVSITESEEGTLIRVPFRPNLRDRMLLRFGDRFSFIRKVLSLWFTLAQYFIPWADNRRNIHEAAREYLKSHSCDAIIATGEPFILFRYAQLLSSEFKVPWVADYRDGWSTDYSILSSPSRYEKTINILLNRPLERFIIRSCALITSAAPAFQEELLQLHPTTPNEVIYNGYFEEMFTYIKDRSVPPRKPFSIAYSGTVYPYQRAEIFLDGLQMLVTAHGIAPSELQVSFIGLDFQPDQAQRIMERHAGLRPFINITPRIRHSDAVEILQHADLLLMFANKEFGQIYAKVFEYMAFQSPVLVCENDHGPIELMLSKSGTGFFADTPAQVADIVYSLMTGKATFQASPEYVRGFTRRNQTRRLSQLLRSIVP